MSEAQGTHDLRFNGQVALITGAASGIGRATAVLWARRGGTAVVADLHENGIGETLEMIHSAGGQAVGCRLDVTAEADWEPAVQLAEQTGGRLHVLVNCAGIARNGPVAELSLDDWRRVLAVNLDGVFLGTRAAVRSMKRTGGGCIVNVSSASGIKAAATASAYCSSKAAVNMFTKTVALECMPDRIRVNAVAPGAVKTPMWSNTPGAAAFMESEEWKAAADAPIHQRFATPEEIAQAILFLASPEASYITGSILSVDAGYTA